MDAFRGELALLPVANPYVPEPDAEHAARHEQPEPCLPGKPDGMLTEQLAHAICEHWLPRLDYLIDLHSGGNLATVDYVYLHDDGALSRAFGCEILFRGPSFPGSFATTRATRASRPS